MAGSCLFALLDDIATLLDYIIVDERGRCKKPALTI
jgi:predicted DNA repair protein MutK